MRISWVWEMRNVHYGVRKKPRKHGKWGMKQDLTTWKFRTQNLVVTYTLTLRTNFEYFPKSIIYRFEAQEVKSPMLQTLCKSKLKWRSYGYLKTTVQSWKTISKFNLWIRNPTNEFKMTPISNSLIATLMFLFLYLENYIWGTVFALNGAHKIKNHNFIIIF